MKKIFKTFLPFFIGVLIFNGSIQCYEAVSHFVTSPGGYSVTNIWSLLKESGDGCTRLALGGLVFAIFYTDFLVVEVDKSSAVNIKEEEK